MQGGIRATFRKCGTKQSIFAKCFLVPECHIINALLLVLDALLQVLVALLQVLIALLLLRQKLHGLLQSLRWLHAYTCGTQRIALSERSPGHNPWRSVHSRSPSQPMQSLPWFKKAPGTGLVSPAGRAPPLRLCAFAEPAHVSCHLRMDVAIAALARMTSMLKLLLSSRF